MYVSLLEIYVCICMYVCVFLYTCMHMCMMNHISEKLINCTRKQNFSHVSMYDPYTKSRMDARAQHQACTHVHNIKHGRTCTPHSASCAFRN